MKRREKKFKQKTLKRNDKKNSPEASQNQLGSSRKLRKTTPRERLVAPDASANARYRVGDHIGKYCNERYISIPLMAWPGGSSKSTSKPKRYRIDD